MQTLIFKLSMAGTFGIDGLGGTANLLPQDMALVVMHVRTLEIDLLLHRMANDFNMSKFIYLMVLWRSALSSKRVPMFPWSGCWSATNPFMAC